MKVFEVITEHCSGDSVEITKTVQYVTAEYNSFLSVVKHYTKHCEEYDKTLIGVREVLTIVEHITRCHQEENSND